MPPPALSRWTASRCRRRRSALPSVATTRPACTFCHFPTQTNTNGSPEFVVLQDPANVTLLIFSLFAVADITNEKTRQNAETLNINKTGGSPEFIAIQDSADAKPIINFSVNENHKKNKKKRLAKTRNCSALPSLRNDPSCMHIVIVQHKTGVMIEFWRYPGFSKNAEPLGPFFLRKTSCTAIFQQKTANTCVPSFCSSDRGSERWA